MKKIPVMYWIVVLVILGIFIMTKYKEENDKRIKDSFRTVIIDTTNVK
jgi:DNA-directed RNA polymerase